MGNKNLVDLGYYKPVSLFSGAVRGSPLLVVERRNRYEKSLVNRGGNRP